MIAHYIIISCRSRRANFYSIHEAFSHEVGKGNYILYSVNPVTDPEHIFGEDKALCVSTYRSIEPLYKKFKIYNFEDILDKIENFDYIDGSILFYEEDEDEEYYDDSHTDNVIDLVEYIKQRQGK